MRLEIPLKEVQSFLTNCYNVNVSLKNIEEDRISLDYFISLVLTIKEVKEHEIIFHYKTNGFLNLLAKGAHAFLEQKLDNAPIEWNSEKSEVNIDLRKVDALKDFLQFLYIADLRFIDETCLLVLKTKNP